MKGKCCQLIVHMKVNVEILCAIFSLYFLLSCFFFSFVRVRPLLIGFGFGTDGVKVGDMRHVGFLEEGTYI